MPTAEQEQAATRPLDVLIVGAGFGGLYAVHKFRSMGVLAAT